jgi:hypothetical protein
MDQRIVAIKKNGWLLRHGGVILFKARWCAGTRSPITINLVESSLLKLVYFASE